MKGHAMTTPTPPPAPSLERMAERGGFGPSEMDMFLPGWRDEVSEITSLRAEVERLRGERYPGTPTVVAESLRHEYARIADLTAERDAALRERDELKVDVESLRVSVAGFRDDLDAALRDAAEQRARAARAEAMCREALESLSRVESALAAAHDQIAAQREELDVAAHRLSESEDACSAAERRLEEARGALRDSLDGLLCAIGYMRDHMTVRGFAGDAAPMTVRAAIEKVRALAAHSTKKEKKNG